MFRRQQEFIESLWMVFEPVVQLLHDQTAQDAASDRMQFLDVWNRIPGKVEDAIFHDCTPRNFEVQLVSKEACGPLKAPFELT